MGEWVIGTTIGDYIGTTWPIPYYISTRLRQLSESRTAEGQLQEEQCNNKAQYDKARLRELSFVVKTGTRAGCAYIAMFTVVGVVVAVNGGGIGRHDEG